LKSAEYYLVYVMKRNEGAVTQYYILPDFDYNSYRSNFVSTTDQSHMKLFLDDSRELFSVNNIAIKEKKVDPNSEIGTLYKKYLSSYYSVELMGADESVLRHAEIGSLFHLTVDKAGKRHLLSGVCESTEQAKGVQNYMRDLKLAEDVKIVRVTPDQIVDAP